MRRALVLTDESARHPFRASLPAHVRLVAGDAEEIDGRFSGHDLRRFLQAYCACFVTVATFIA